jgi:single-strand DNA-binding protein
MINQILLLGYLGADAQVTRLDSGKMVYVFSVATTEFSKQNENRTEWHKIKAFELPAHVAQGLKKGALVWVRGRVRTNSYKDKDNQQKYDRYVLPDKYYGVVLCVKAGSASTAPDIVNDNDIPF